MTDDYENVFVQSNPFLIVENLNHLKETQKRVGKMTIEEKCRCTVQKFLLLQNQTENLAMNLLGAVQSGKIQIIKDVYE